MEPAKKKTAAILATLGLLTAACGSTVNSSSDGSNTPDISDIPTSPGSSEAIPIPNNGTSAFEGHTPRGFAGTGTGLFAGDNLNPNFPNGDGVQIWLTFAVPEGTGVPSNAVLRSDVLSTSGNAFEALGDLQVVPVSFEAFGPQVFDLEPTGDLVTCERPTDSSLTCDVTGAATAAIEAGDSRVQLRMTFEEISDSDGEQDLARFFLTDSNTNEPGIFFLDLS